MVQLYLSRRIRLISLKIYRERGAQGVRSREARFRRNLAAAPASARHSGLPFCQRTIGGPDSLALIRESQDE